MPMSSASSTFGNPALGQQVGGDEAAGAVERRLAERQQAGVAEQDVEADAEQAPDQDAVDRVGREAEMRQHERRRDQAERRQTISTRKRSLLEHQRGEPSFAAAARRTGRAGRTTSTSVIAANSMT